MCLRLAYFDSVLNQHTLRILGTAALLATYYDQHLRALGIAHEELHQAHAELQEAAVRSMRYAALEERVRLSSEIHDGVGHQLTSLIIQLQALELMLPDDVEQASAVVPEMIVVARRA
jgi:signal transduction histidine kinase